MSWRSQCALALGLATGVTLTVDVSAEAPLFGGSKRQVAAEAASLGGALPAPAPRSAPTSGPPDLVLPYGAGLAAASAPVSETAALERLVAPEPATRPSLRWVHWSLAVSLNGRKVADAVPVIEAAERGRLAIDATLPIDWPVPINSAGSITVNGARFLPLEAIPGVQARLDASSLTLALAFAAPSLPPVAAAAAPLSPTLAAHQDPASTTDARPATGGRTGPARASARVDDDLGQLLPPRLEAIEPAAGLSFRRDPVLPPLLEEQRWIEWILSVTLNGRPLPDAVVVIEEPQSGRLAVELGAAEAWRLLIDRARILTFEGVPFLPLDAIGGVAVDLDAQALALELEIPPEAFALSRFAVGAEGQPAPTPGTGAFLDYDLLVNGGQVVADQLDGLLEAGVFAGGHVLLGNLRVQDAAGDPEVQRLETTLSRDFPDRRATFRFGDSLTTGGAFAQGLRFGGLQWSTNFATDPAFVTFPLPTIGGLAEQDSVVDVIVDNLTRATETVPSGPFSIDNVPVVTGGGEVQLRVTDLLGRERLVTQSYYVSTRLLRQGLSDFSYEAGFARQAFGETSFDYGEFVASGTHRYGFTDTATGEVHAELEPDRFSLVAGGAFLLGHLGVLTGGLGGSVDAAAGQGVVGQLAYEYVDRRFSLGVRTRYTSAAFRQAAGDDGRLERVDQVNLGYDTFGLGRLGLLLLNQERHGGDDQRSVTASYSLPMGPGSVVINAARTLEPERDYAITAAYSLSLGPSRSLSATSRLSNGSNRARLQYNRTRGASEIGLDYRLATEIGDDNRPIEGRIAYQSPYAGTEAAVERFAGENRFRLGVNGSVSMVDGNFGLSRRIGRSFGLVDLPGFPNVRVYLDNREAGVTNAQGKLLLPNLRPYEPNLISLAVDDLPLTAELATAETTAVPFDRSGMTIDFGILAVQRATAILLDRADEPLPPGHGLVSDDGELEAMIGRDGFTQLSGDLTQRRYLVGSVDGRRVICAVPIAPALDPLPHLGDVRCAD